MHSGNVRYDFPNNPVQELQCYLSYLNAYLELLELHGKKPPHEGFLFFDILVDDSKVDYNIDFNFDKLTKSDCEKLLPEIHSDHIMLTPYEKNTEKENEPEWNRPRKAILRDKKGIEREYERYALDFMPWSKLIDMPVLDESIEKYGSLLCAAELLWEVTWHGFSSNEGEEKGKDIRRRKEDFENSLKDHEG